MDNSLQTPLEIGLERKHIAIRGQRHIIVLKIVGDIVAFCIFLGFSQTSLMQGAYFTAHQQKAGGTFVLQRSVIGNAAAQCGKGEQRQRLSGGKVFKRGQKGCLGVDTFRNVPGKSEALSESP